MPALKRLRGRVIDRDTQAMESDLIGSARLGAKLARVLRFYADKARRHADDDNTLGLSKDAYGELIAEIDRLIEKGGDYPFASAESADRGWVFCPEYASATPMEITPSGWTREDSNQGFSTRLPFGPGTP